MATSGNDMSELARLSEAELEAEVTTLAAHIHAGTCRWLQLVGKLDRRNGWAADGPDSRSAWIAWRCGLKPRTAREYVRVARRLPELPQIHAAFAAGEFSYAKIRALTRVATRENEGSLLDFARIHTAAQLERCVRAYRRVTLEEARDQQENAQLSVFWNPDGSLELHGRLAPEDGALLLRALDAMRDSLRKQAGGSAEPRPARQASNAEALVAVADAALAHEGEGRTGGERDQVVVHIDEPALSGSGDGAASSTTAARSHPRPRAVWRAVPRSSATAGNRARSPRRCGARSGAATGAAASRAARTAASSMPTTSTTGRGAAERR